MSAHLIPTTLDEAIDLIIADTPEADLKTFAANPSAYHHGFGTGLRNSWGLWFNETPLARWFHSYGVEHGDDRSGIIFEALTARVLGQPFSIEKRAAWYKAWWAKRGCNPDGSPIPGAKQRTKERLFVKKGGKVEEVD